MASNAQRRAVRNYRSRLSERGARRFEVIAPAADRELIRALAKLLSEDTPMAEDIRASVVEAMGPTAAAKGGIFAALRRSPLVGAGVVLTRAKAKSRPVKL